MIPFSFWKKSYFVKDKKVIWSAFFSFPFLPSPFPKASPWLHWWRGTSACPECLHRRRTGSSSRFEQNPEELTYSRKIILKSTCLGAYFRASISNCLKIFKLFFPRLKSKTSAEWYRVGPARTQSFPLQLGCFELCKFILFRSERRMKSVRSRPKQGSVGERIKGRKFAKERKNH